MNWHIANKEYIKYLEKFDSILTRKAKKLYQKCLENPEGKLYQRCCNFALLEERSKEYKSGAK